MALGLNPVGDVLKKADKVLAHAGETLGTVGDTLGMLARYGYEPSSPRDMRDIVCPKPVKGEKPPKEPSEQAEEEPKSVYQLPFDHVPQLVAVGPGNAPGPVPKAYAEMLANNYADVPIPTPRPDYPETTAAKAGAEQGDGD